MRRAVSALSLSVLALVAFMAAKAQASIIYNLDQIVGTMTVTGTITTDGYIGVFPSSSCCLPEHILDWDVTVTSGTTSQTMFGPLSGSNSIIGGLSANSLTATPTALIWTPQADGGLFNIQSSPVVNVVAIGFAGAGYGYFFAEIPPLGDQINFTSSRPFFFATSAVPEASTWAMLLIGFAGIGFITYRRKSKAAFPNHRSPY